MSNVLYNNPGIESIVKGIRYLKKIVIWSEDSYPKIIFPKELLDKISLELVPPSGERQKMKSI